jgi:uncharacterized protein
MTRQWLLWLALVFSTLASVTATAAPPAAKVALVIGNSEYSGAWHELQGEPLQDAEKMRGVLRDVLHFEVIYRTNADQKQMDDALREFREKLQQHPGALALVYYAGHGAQAPLGEGEAGVDNYLIPARTDLRYESDAPYKAIRQERLEDIIRSSGADAGVIILDACRDNGLERRKDRGVVPPGLSAHAGTDILVVYSAASGHSARNTGVFTAALAREIVSPGSLVTALFRVRAQVIEATRLDDRGPQEPELLSKLQHDIVIIPGPHGPTAHSGPPAQECDRLAQPDAPGPGFVAARGVALDKMDGAAALLACERALKAFPGEARFTAYLGRALQRLGRVDEAAARYREAVAKGDALAQNNLGFLYQNGTGVQKNPVEAAKWYQLAAEQGFSVAQNNLGFLYQSGTGVQKNPVEAAKWFRLAADQGFSVAQVNIGAAYEWGHGVAQNETEAARWYRLAAEQGDAAGQFNLASMYMDGKGVVHDDGEAVKWFRLSAEQGNALGQSGLAAMYADGRGVPKDGAEALKWFRKAADQGNAGAQSDVGEAYRQGLGVPRNETLAVEWFRKSAAQGDIEGQFGLGESYAEGWGVPRDDAEAIKWFRLSAGQGYSAAEDRLGMIYANGRGVPKNFTEAVKWYRLAAEAGDAYGQFHLGQSYENGWGVPPDVKQAVIWYRLAAERGNPKARQRLQALAP